MHMQLKESYNVINTNCTKLIYAVQSMHAYVFAKICKFILFFFTYLINNICPTGLGVYAYNKYMKEACININ